MKLALSLALLVLCSQTFFGQKPADAAQVKAQQILIRKQILASELDNQAKDVPLAAARVFIRTKLAQWLWRDGADKTGRAEQIAVKAVEELYEKKDEIPDSNFLKMDLFALLETNAKETAKKLRAKYDVGSDEDLSNAVPLLNKEGGDKIIAAKIKKYLAEGKDLGAIAFLMGMLQSKKSPEFLSVLAEIVNLEETGRSSFTADSLTWAADFFRDADIPNNLRLRFYRIALSKARNALQNPEGNNILAADYLLNAILPNIAANAPELSAEASGIKAALLARTSQKSREMQERNQRIEESADKLGALISEAEKTDDKGEKYSLLIRAELLAKKEGKFRLAVDLMEKTIEDKSEGGFPTQEFRLRYYDQELGYIAESALGKDDVEAARYAAKKMIKELSKADTLRRIAVYFNGKKDGGSALDAYDEALKLATRADNDKLKFYTLFRLISAAQQIEQSRVSEVTAITAKAINALPILGVEDKPDTENFKNYVSIIVAVNFNLYPVIGNLAKANKNEASGFASRIDRKEVRIVADFALAVDAIDSDFKQIKTK